MLPPKKTLDEMLNEDSPVPGQLSSHLGGDDRFTQSPASSVFLALERALSGIWEYLREDREKGEHMEMEEEEEEVEEKICPPSHSQPRRPPLPSTPSRSSVLGEAVVRFNFTADTPVEFSLRKAALQAITDDWISLTLGLPSSSSSLLPPSHSLPVGGHASSSAQSTPPTPPPYPASFACYSPFSPAPTPPPLPMSCTPGPTPPPYPRGLLLELQELDALLDNQSALSREQEEEELSKELVSFIHANQPQSRRLPAVIKLSEWLDEKEVSDKKKKVKRNVMRENCQESTPLHAVNESHSPGKTPTFKVLYNYNPYNEDELELKEGDIVDVMEQCDDGWFVEQITASLAEKV
ncbi:hypothetical protein CRUP_030347 [Coryphaenoides rupestris]|nr:hypothetical protein CRUP_030347 [Coryphaenoides rupestris]